MADNRITRIYVLRDPRDGAVRYVGKTVRALSRRLRQHVQVSRQGKLDTRVARWIRSLLAVGIEPTIEQIDQATDDWERLEIYWIAHYRQRGFDLVNHTAGGEGALGRKPSDKHIAIISEATRQRWADPEHSRMRKAAMRAGQTPETTARRSKSGARAWTPERIAQQAEKMRAKRAAEAGDEALLAVMTEAARVAWLDPEHKADRIKKMKAVWTPERRAVFGERSRAQWTPEYRAAMSIRAKAQRAREIAAKSAAK